LERRELQLPHPSLVVGQQIGMATQVLFLEQSEKPAWLQMQLPQLSKLGQEGFGKHRLLAAHHVKLAVVERQFPQPS